ncbi:MAG TPA: N-acetylmuramidase domain-containing protein [Vicinamibacterales bacterium]|jgi:hypothetical protein
MDFIGTGRPLSPAGMAAALSVIGFSPTDAAYLWTVIEVETSGVTQGFGFRFDRRPHILFERHKFRDFTAGRFNAQAPDISGPPGNYGSTQSQYNRLDRAIGLCVAAGLGPEPALRSASWGIGQVMGFNHVQAGYSSAKAMAMAMKGGEDFHLMAMVKFLEDANLAQHLRNRDWRKFAIGYNGQDQWKNQYEVKLAENFSRFASGSLPSLPVREAQAALLYLGYASGKIDGVVGPRTQNALASFRVANGLQPAATLDTETLDRLRTAVGW